MRERCENIVTARRHADTQALGCAAEQQALQYLQAQGLRLIASNFRRKFGEIDLIMQHQATLVFVEVRSRAHAGFGCAAASVTPAKQRRLIRAAQAFLQRYQTLPPCRFDLIALDGTVIRWLKDIISS